MAKPLIIAEKKMMAQDIAKVLGGGKEGGGKIDTDDFLVTWASGHLLEASPPDVYTGKVKWTFDMLPIFPDNVIMKKTGSPNKDRQLDVIEKLLGSSDHVVHAGDNDREGQVIVDEILEFFSFSGKVERLIINDINLIGEALKKMVDNTTRLPLYHAGLARSVADWEVGMNLSPALCMATEERLGVGRIQTAVLKMIYNRENLLNDFKEMFYYVPALSLAGTDVKGSWVVDPDTESLDDKNRITIEDYAAVIAKSSTGEGKVVSVKEEAKSDSPPLGFTLDKFRSEVRKRFNIPIKKTLEIYQSMYEKTKVVTYPRVECAYLPESVFETAQERVDALAAMVPSLTEWCTKADVTQRTKIWNDKEVAKESHYALTLTGVTASPDADEIKLLTILGERLLVQFLGLHEYVQTTMLIEVGGHVYKIVGKKVTSQGWKALTGVVADTLLPDWEEGAMVDCKGSVEKKKTSPPKRYTETSLVDDMLIPSRLTTDPKIIKVLKKSKGIGRPSTRATFVPKLLDHGLIESRKPVKNKQKGEEELWMSDKGNHLISTLGKVGGDKACDPVTTALWETALDKIALGKMSKDDFIASQRAFIMEVITAAEAFAPERKVCPDCGDLMNKRTGKFGVFYGCSGYPDCSTILDKDGVKKVKKPVVHGDDCPKCKKPTIERVTDNGTFYGCSGYPKCKYLYQKDAPSCTDCDSRMSKSKGGKDWFCYDCFKKNKKTKKGK